MVEGGMEPPPGVTPDFDNPSRSGWIANMAMQPICISLAVVAITLRLYARLGILRTFGVEDWLAIAGFVVAVAYSATTLVMGQYGGGLNQWEVDKEKVPKFRLSVFIAIMLYGPAAFFIKTSILTFLNHIFSPIRPAVLVIRTMQVVLLTYYLTMLILKACICRPLSKFWIPEAPGECFDQRTLFIADTTISVLSDVIIFTIPLPLACNLHVRKRQRVKVATIFSAGGLACIASVVRLIDLVRFGNDPNQTRVFMRENLLAVAEVYLGFITACMPFMPAIYHQYFGSGESEGTDRCATSGDRSIEMWCPRRREKKQDVTVRQQTPEYGSNENILGNDMPTSNEGASSLDETPKSDRLETLKREKSSSPVDRVRIVKGVGQAHIHD